ncbi:MAG: hypothetical protein K2X28_08760 [Alphaproteobacteria bacterium]|nr:hypothetical protein [Alphaproteobacteria bacterium]
MQNKIIKKHLNLIKDYSQGPHIPSSRTHAVGVVIHLDRNMDCHTLLRKVRSGVYKWLFMVYPPPH